MLNQETEVMIVMGFIYFVTLYFGLFGLNVCLWVLFNFTLYFKGTVLYICVVMRATCIYSSVYGSHSVTFWFPCYFVNLCMTLANAAKYGWRLKTGYVSLW